MTSKRKQTNSQVNPHLKRQRTDKKKILQEVKRPRMSLKDAASANKKNRLLSLPGEILNRIYDMVLADFEDTYCGYKRSDITPILREQQPQPSLKCTLVLLRPKNRRPTERAEYLYMKKDWVALSHVSHQIRHEFRSLQNTSSQVYIHAELLLEFLSKLFRCNNSTVATTSISTFEHPAKLTIVFDRGSKINVLPLMQLLHRAPTLQFDVWTLENGEARDHALHGMIFGAQNSLRTHLTTELSGHVLRVSFQPGEFLEIRIQEKYGATWMAKDCKGGQEWQGALWRRTRGNGITKGGTWIKDRQNRTREWLEDAGVDIDSIKNWSVTEVTSS